jgi:phosphohistidine phosphatase
MHSPQGVATDLYLMQHGEAMAEAEDPARPLTDAGRAAVEQVAARAQAAGVSVVQCVHSGKLRAEQTAQVLTTAVGGDVQVRDGLAPNDPVAPVAEWLRGSTQAQSIALVGHMPFLDRLASLLIADDENAHVIQFSDGRSGQARDEAGSRRAHGRLRASARARVTGRAG